MVCTRSVFLSWTLVIPIICYDLNMPFEQPLLYTNFLVDWILLTNSLFSQFSFLLLFILIVSQGLVCFLLRYLTPWFMIVISTELEMLQTKLNGKLYSVAQIKNLVSVLLSQWVERVIFEHLLDWMMVLSCTSTVV